MRIGQSVALGLLAAAGAMGGQEPAFSWQKPHAKVLPTGGLEWAPEPFAFAAGKAVRYIDFAAGSDTNDGATKEKPWKRHPWDPAATGQAKGHRGPTTYVFRRGVIYRGHLVVPADDQGTPEEPIRLTSDPAWGNGQAVLCGSETVTGWKRGAAHKDIPEPERVWWADLDFAPRCLWMVDREGKIARIPLARTPNWRVSDPDDVKSEWWHWDYKGMKPFDVFTEAGGRKLHLGVDTEHLTRPADYYQDAILWTEHGWVMGAPYPVRVEAVDTAKRGLGFGGRWGAAGSYKIVKFCRYYLEDKPHYLNDPEGEFWFDKKGEGGRLYLRLPSDADPNSVRIEAARHLNLLDSKGMSHIHVTGLTFRFTNVHWRLDGVPYAQGEELDSACIRLLGAGRDIRVAHCLFEHVSTAVRMKAPAKEDAIDGVVVADNEVRFTDRGGFHLLEGSPWGETVPKSGLLYDVNVLRSKLQLIGLRPTRFNLGFAIDILNAQTAEVAGNVLDRCYSGGINVHGAKRSGSLRDCPLARVLIHHNKVTDCLLSNDDFGGIETWQGGPFYVYCNISGNPGGYRNFGLLDPTRPGWARFGHAYYLDGAFKNYLFNNIAWGKSKDPLSRLGNSAAFQEIISYENAFFNNTVYNFVKGTRRQAPHAGRNKFLGNVWSGIGEWLFWHAQPAKSEAEGNAADAGPPKEHFAHESNAYARNVFHDVSDKFACFEPSGRWHGSLESFRKGLAARQALASTVGELSEKPVLRDPAKHDFRLAPGSAAVDAGVKVFVPWSLYAAVGEWHFTRNQKEPTQVIDEHWYMTPYYGKRDDYWKTPRYPLRAVNVKAEDYIDGPLEDWTQGALRLNGKDQYLVLSQEEIAKPFGEGDGQEKKTVDIGEGSFLVEAYFRAEPGHTGGALVSKMAERGYELSLDGDGRVTFLVRGVAAASASTRERANDGQWHHAVAECDRGGKALRLYLDGRMAADLRGERVDGSLANPADFLVGKGAKGGCFAGAIEFLRVCRGTLADAKTTIEELYAWQFNGPQHRDFCGRPPAGKGRDAGALELIP
ncbi:MAG: LamG domain-containing protein [Planctomycetes bacterium]|nr:LamG domain-containing protein [Planctomycetota bacterium]